MSSHKNLTGTNLHETKGISDAANNEVATATSHQTVWKKLTHLNLTGTGNPFGDQLLHVFEARSAGTNGGTLTENTWDGRQFTGTADNEITGATRSAQGVLSLPAGTYFCQGFAVAYDCGKTQLRLRSTNGGGATLVTGFTMNSGVGDDMTVVVPIFGRFVLSATRNVELQHNCTATKLASGRGLAAHLGPERYADLMIWKVA